METVDIDSRCIYGEAKDAEPASQTMDKWAYPLTNVCKCGNGQEPKPCATVKDANGVVLLQFNGIPWRSNKDSTAMATEFCERMNAQGNKPVGNAAKMREALERINSLCGIGVVDVSSFEIGSICDAALSAPPRNCDRFADELDAQLAFLNEVWLIFVTKDTMLEKDKFENWTEEMKSIYAKWLFAEAEEENK
jgi:hypothetical protein